MSQSSSGSAVRLPWRTRVCRDEPRSGHGAPPSRLQQPRTFEVPGHGRLQTVIERYPRTKATLPLDLRTVDCVAPVVARPITHVAQEALACVTARGRRVRKTRTKRCAVSELLVNDSAQHAHQFKILALRATADVVHL